MQLFKTNKDIRVYVDSVLPSVPFPTTFHHLTGSSVICPNKWLKNPTDIDVVVYYEGELSAAAENLQAAGFTPCCADADAHYADEGSFIAYRFKYLNLIVVNVWDTYMKWLVATQAAATLNLHEKTDRVRLFKFIQEDL